MVKITVYIVSHNYGRFLDQAIQSVINQTFKNWEVIIFDDNSIDDTYEIASKYVRTSSHGIYVIKNSENLGLQKIANMAIALAQGDYLLRIDADDYLHPTALQTLYKAISKDKSYEMAYSNFYYIDEVGNILGTEKSTSRNESGNVQDIVAPHGACSLISLDFLKSVNGYNEEINAQDGWDIWYKLKSHGKFIKVNEPLFYYRQHSTSLSRDHGRLIKARNSIIDKNLIINYNSEDSSYCIIAIKEDFPVSSTTSDQNFGIHLVLSAINQAFNCEMIKKVVVTSENDKVLKVLKSLLSEEQLERTIFILRKKTFSFDKTFSLNGILGLINEYLSTNNLEIPRYWVYLGLMTKNRDANNISRVLKLLISFNYRSVVSVVEERSPIFQLGKSSLKVLNPGRFNSLEYYDEKILKYNGALIAIDNKDVSQRDLFSDSIGYLEMSQDDSKEWS